MDHEPATFKEAEGLAASTAHLLNATEKALTPTRSVGAYNEEERWLIGQIWKGDPNRTAKELKAEAARLFPPCAYCQCARHERCLDPRHTGRCCCPASVPATGEQRG